MQNPQLLIKNYLQNWLERNDLNLRLEISIPTDMQFGDFVSNVAMVSFKDSIGFKSPRDLAENIVSFLKEAQEVNEIFDKIEIAGPGFINFHLSRNYLLEGLNKIVQNGRLNHDSNKKDTQKIIVEFGNPNPFKEIHIGHLRNFAIGESYSRMLEFLGNKVVRVNYQGDVGLHVAKAIYGIKKLQLDESNLSADDLGKAYATGATEYDGNETTKKEIQETNKKIYMEDDSVKPLWEKGRQVSLEDFEKFYERISVSYDQYYFESTTAKRGKEIVLQNIDNGVFERDGGAVVYRGEAEGLHTRVFLTREDYATYEGKDLALAILKDEENHYDKSIIQTGNEQAEYFQVMLAALRKIRPDLEQKTIHYTFAHVRLKDGKMSSRTGDVVLARWLLDEAVKKVSEKFPDVEEVSAEKIGVGAIKYSMLKFAPNSEIHFDFEDSVSLEGNSGPYVQYAYVRAQSVVRNSKKEMIDVKEFGKMEKEEEDLLRFLFQFEKVVEKSVVDYGPNLLCNFLFELSQKFNLVYQKYKIIDSENEVFRLQLAKSVGLVLKKGLDLLGIEVVEKM